MININIIVFYKADLMCIVQKCIDPKKHVLDLDLIYSNPEEWFLGC